MACYQAVVEQLAKLPIVSSDCSVLAVCVGDGRTPRTAALLAMRTRWDCVSIDPALEGLEEAAEEAVVVEEEEETNAGAIGSPPRAPISGGGSTSDEAAATSAPTRLQRVRAAQGRRGPSAQPLPTPKELRHTKLRAQEHTPTARARRARVREGVRCIDRLRLLACRAEEAAVWVGDGVTHVVLLLPHAHLTPDEALGCVRFALDEQRAQWPTISLVQLPCCAYVWHDRALGTPPDGEKLDGRVCASARTVRVWADVSARFNFSASAFGLGARTAHQHGSSASRQ